MKRTVLWAIGATILLPLHTIAAPAGEASRVFERLTALAGIWEGDFGEGKTARLTYRLTANGSVLMEEFEVVEDPSISMITMYHRDREDLILTHYCMDDNQPRMRARWDEGNPDTITFDFLDATNLASPADGHMHRAVLELLGPDRMRQRWTYRKDGKDAFTEDVTYHREPSAHAQQ